MYTTDQLEAEYPDIKFYVYEFLYVSSGKRGRVHLAVAKDCVYQSGSNLFTRIIPGYTTWYLMARTLEEYVRNTTSLYTIFKQQLHLDWFTDYQAELDVKAKAKQLQSSPNPPQGAPVHTVQVPVKEAFISVLKVLNAEFQTLHSIECIEVRLVGDRLYGVLFTAFSDDGTWTGYTGNLGEVFEECQSWGWFNHLSIDEENTLSELVKIHLLLTDE